MFKKLKQKIMFEFIKVFIAKQLDKFKVSNPILFVIAGILVSTATYLFGLPEFAELIGSDVAAKVLQILTLVSGVLGLNARTSRYLPTQEEEK